MWQQVNNISPHNYLLSVSVFLFSSHFYPHNVVATKWCHDPCMASLIPWLWPGRRTYDKHNNEYTARNYNLKINNSSTRCTESKSATLKLRHCTLWKLTITIITKNSQYRKSNSKTGLIWIVSQRQPIKYLNNCTKTNHNEAYFFKVQSVKYVCTSVSCMEVVWTRTGAAVAYEWPVPVTCSREKANRCCSLLFARQDRRHSVGFGAIRK